VDKVFTYRALFDQYAKPDEKFDEEWIEEFEDAIIENGDVVGTHSWESDNPGAGAGMIFIYRFKGLFFTLTDFGLDGPYEGFSEAAEAVNLLTVTETTDRIWVDYKVNPDSGTDDDEDDERNVQRRFVS
jgi:hypothetical protein